MGGFINGQSPHSCLASVFSQAADRRRTHTNHITNSALTMVRLYFLLFPGKTQPSIHRTYAD